MKQQVTALRPNRGQRRWKQQQSRIAELKEQLEELSLQQEAGAARIADYEALLENALWRQTLLAERVALAHDALCRAMDDDT